MFAAVIMPVSARAQQPANEMAPLEALCVVDATAGSPVERTLLAVGLLTDADVSTSLRPLSPTDARRIAAVAHLDSVENSARCRGRFRGIGLRALYNTGAPDEAQDGAVWQGRGLTLSGTIGWVGSFGPLSISLRPLAFVAQNQAYSPRPAPARGPTDFRDPVWGEAIDLPYRFGNKPYGAVDPGETYVRVDKWHVGAGFTTASQQWGPAEVYPLVLGTEGPAFPRAFVEGHSIPIGIGDVSAHWEMGVIEASPYTTLPPGDRSRVASAVIASFRPALFRGLEIGGTRFFHVRREPGSLTWSNATLPFSGLVKQSSREPTNAQGANQMASLFARVAPPGAGVEAYAEFYRDDHNIDLRDLASEPDHESAYVAGLRRIWGRSTDTIVVTVEHANGRASHLARVRPEPPMYTHTRIIEGHTSRGQPLGSAALFRGGGTAIAVTKLRHAQVRELAFSISPAATNSEGGSYNGQFPGEYSLEFFNGWMRGGNTLATYASLHVPYGRGPAAHLVLGANISLEVGR